MGKIKNISERIIDICYNLAIGIVAVVAVYLVLQVFVCTTFKIPSDSMAPAIVGGDRILTQKWSLGARLFNLSKAMNNEPVTIRRMPGTGSVHHNDVLVFNWPYLHNWDTIQMDAKRYYVKRCIAIPGDTLEIRDGFYVLRGKEILLGNQESQQRLQRLLRNGREHTEQLFGTVWQGYPHDDSVDWNIQNFGPLYIPGRGDTLRLNHTHFVLYRQLIGWEQKQPLTCRNDSVFLAGKHLPIYTFQKNYYFVAGDKVEDSQDSRYWGLLPEEFIVGKATHILYSTEKKHRILKKIK